MVRDCLALLVMIAACSGAGHDAPETVAPAAAVSRLPTGQAAYDKACAGCHDEGIGEAPAVGDRQAWAGRSSLWVAVLAEHARQGYLQMPAKGGDPGLSDEEVAAAAEYMMTLTHPDRPPE